MKKWTKNISCLILASAMIVHLSGRAFALDEEPVDPENSAQIISDASEEQDDIIDPNGQENQEGQESQDDQKEQEEQEGQEDQQGQKDQENQDGQESQEDQEDQKDQIDQEDQQDQNDPEKETDMIEEVFVLNVDPELAVGQQMLMMDRSVSAESAGAGTDAGEEARTAEVTPLLMIGEQEIDLTADSSGENWKYNSVDGSVELSELNDAGILIGTAGQGLTIKAAGFNRIGSLVIDGDINLAGSGILLVDSIEFPQDSDFNLQTNTRIYTDGTCSVAVFLKQEDGTYLLINGEMPGVLDGDCTIPAGVKLVMPANTSLVLQSVSRSGYNDNYTYSIEDFGTIGYDIPYTTAPKLTISSGAALIVDQLAQILFRSISGEHVYYTGLLNDVENRQAVTFAPSIRVEGELELNSGVTNAVLSFGSDASFSGAGVISNSSIDVDGERQQALGTLSVKDSEITLNGEVDLDGLIIDGDSSLNIKGNTTIGMISMKDGSTLTCSDNKGFGENHTVSITGPVSAENRTVTMASVLPVVGPIDFSGLIDPIIYTLPGEAEIRFRSGIYVLEQSASVSGVRFSSGWQLSEYAALRLFSEKDVPGTAALFNYSGSEITTDMMISRNGTGSVNGSASATMFPVIIPVTLASVVNLGKGSVSSAFLAKDDSPESSVFGCVIGTYLTKELLSGRFENYSSFVLEVIDGNGRYSLVKVTDETSISSQIVKHIYAFQNAVIPPEIEGGGGSATNTSTSYTGTGNLGGQAGSTTGGSNTRLFGGSGITNPVTAHSNPGDNTPGDNTPGDNTPGDNTPGDNTPGDNTPGDNTPGDNTPGDNTPGDNTPGDNTPGDNTPGDNTPGDNTPGGNTTGNNTTDKETENSGTGSGEENRENDAEKENGTRQTIVAGSVKLTVQVKRDGKEKQVFILTVLDEMGRPVSRLGEKIEIRMDYSDASAEKNLKLYAVFRNEDGSLEAVRAMIDPLSGKLVFRTDRTGGRFVIVVLDYDGEEFSPAFYEILRRLPAVAAL